MRNSDGEFVFTGTWQERGLSSGCDLGPPPLAESVGKVAEVEPISPPPPPEPEMVMETLTWKQDALFIINSYKPTPEGSHDAISELADKFNIYREIEFIQINGYTGSSGPAEFNQMLSEKRANSVKKLLVENGVDSSIIKTRGFGESDPIASNGMP